MRITNKNAKIYVAGHRGLVGSAIVRALTRAGYTNIVVRTRQEVDLANAVAVNDFFESEKPEFVFDAAAKVGGILANSTYPADFIMINLAIQLNIVKACHEHSVKRLVFLGSSCIYPKMSPQPMKEEHLLTGPLEESNEWYAIAKIAGIKMCQAYRKQYGSDFVSLMPTNLYGPGDNFDLKNSHVLPALIRKFHEAKNTNPHGDVVMWGTGSPKREFLYSDDMADACIFILEQSEDKIWEVAPDGIFNLGVGLDISIRELAERVKEIVGCKGNIVLDTSKPDGTPRKLMNVDRLSDLGWKATTSLTEGIAKMYAWFIEHQQDARLG